MGTFLSGTLSSRTSANGLQSGNTCTLGLACLKSVCYFDNTPPNKSMERIFDSVFRLAAPSLRPVSKATHFRR